MVKSFIIKNEVRGDLEESAFHRLIAVTQANVRLTPYKKSHEALLR